ncbi:MAG: cytidylate kinase-like family protein [Pirellulales bacterium]|nr:cytidylate kinase-like family protein [Planctomycetales bacterium]
MAAVFPPSMGLQSEPDLTKLAAQHRLDEWLRSPKIARRIQSKIDRGEIKELVGPFITISREAGAGAGVIAERLAERLGWDVLDRQVLSYMADHFDRPQHMLHVVDETAAHWIHDVLRCWFDPKRVTHQKYVTNLGKFVTLAGCHGKVIFVGRGAQFILPAGRGVTIRAVASRAFRVAEMAQRHDVPRAAAEKLVDEIDKGRRDFIRRHFHRDPDDPHLYDLVVNTETLGVDTTVDLIEKVCRERYGP